MQGVLKNDIAKCNLNICLLAEGEELTFLKFK